MLNKLKVVRRFHKPCIGLTI